MTGSLKPEIRRVKPEKFRLLFSAFLISVFCLLAFAPAAQANCASPVGSAGNIMYNKDHHVPQYCDGTNWIAMGQQSAGGGGGSNTVFVTSTPSTGAVGSVAAANTRWPPSPT